MVTTINKHRRLCGVAMLIHAGVIGAQEPKDFSVFSQSETLTYAENLSIDAWLDNLHAPNPSPGEYAITRNETEFGIGFRGFSFAAFARRDYYFHFNNDTFDLFYMDKNHIKKPENGHFDILLEVAHVDIQGAKFAFEFSPFSTLSAKVTLSAFTADKLQFGEMTGFIDNKNNKVGGDVLLDYNYTKNYVLRRPLTAPGEGDGGSFRLGFRWQPRDNIAVQLLMQDMYGFID